MHNYDIRQFKFLLPPIQQVPLGVEAPSTAASSPELTRYLWLAHTAGNGTALIQLTLFPGLTVQTVLQGRKREHNFQEHSSHWQCGLGTASQPAVKSSPSLFIQAEFLLCKSISVLAA